MSSIWTNGIQISIFGESHSPAIGVVLDHLPADKQIDLAEVRAFLRRRQARSDGTTTTRLEPDLPEVISGLVNNRTTGTPLCMMIKNTNVRSGDYKNLQTAVRPGHADYTGFLKYHGANDIRGGGHFSGRLTACLVMAGAVCAQILAQYGVESAAHLLSVRHLKGTPIDTMQITKQELKSIRELPFPVIDSKQRQDVISFINDTRMSLDSVGGIVECVTLGMPAGIGEPMMGGIENLLSSLLFSIPGVKGVEFGDGFACTEHYGSENNDPFVMKNDTVQTTSNHNGGILGGITSGMPINVRVALKPTPSIARPQQTVDVAEQKDTTLEIVGRHDPCIAVRAVPVVEACCSIALLSAFVKERGLS